MKKLLILFASLICLSINAQTLKTYTGNYNCLIKPNMDTYGKVRYTYYEQDNKRMYHGQFSYSDSRGTLKGKFKDDKQDGVWTFSQTTNFTIGKKYYNGKRVISITFSDGVPNGPLKISLVDSKTNTPQAYIKVNFNNGLLVGDVSGKLNRRLYGFSCYDYSSVYDVPYHSNMSGTFNEQGLPCANWIVKNPTCVISELYNNDGTFSIIETNPSTGDSVDNFRHPHLPNMVIDLVNYALRATLMRGSLKIQLPLIEYDRDIITLSDDKQQYIEFLD